MRLRRNIAPLLILFVPLAVYVYFALKEIAVSLPRLRLSAIMESAGPLRESLIIAGATTLLSLLIGSVLGYLFSRTNLAGKRLLGYLCCLPFFIPPYVQAYAWVFLLGKKGVINQALMNAFSLSKPLLSVYGIPGAIWTLTLSYFPVMTFLVFAGLESWAPSLEESGSLHYPRLKTVRHIAFPLIAPHLLAGAMLTFIFSLSQFGVPALLEVRTYSVELFVQISAFFNKSEVLLRTFPLMILVGLMAIGLYKTKEKGSFSLSQLGHRTESIRLGAAGQLLGAGFALGLVFLAVLLPVGALLYQSRGAGVVLRALGESKDAVLFSLWTALAAACCVVFLSVPLTSRVKEAGAELSLKLAAISLLMVPGAILGMGMILLWNNRWTGFIYSSPAVLILTYVVLFVPYGLLAVMANRKQIDKSGLEAAALSGAGRFTVFRKILFPLLRPGLKAAWLVTFILCLGELAATIMVIPPGKETISLRVFSAMHYGESSMIAAASLMPLILSAAVLVLLPAARTARKAWT